MLFHIKTTVCLEYFGQDCSLKAEVGKSDIDKLVPVPLDLSKLSDVVKIDVVKKLCVIN